MQHNWCISLQGQILKKQLEHIFAKVQEHPADVMSLEVQSEFNTYNALAISFLQRTKKRWAPEQSFTFLPVVLYSMLYFAATFQLSVVHVVSFYKIHSFIIQCCTKTKILGRSKDHPWWKSGWSVFFLAGPWLILYVPKSVMPTVFDLMVQLT